MYFDYDNLISSSTSYLVNYEIQFKMYDWLDKKTEETQWLKLPGIGMCCASTLVTTVTRVSGIAEVFFKGLGILATSPFTNNRINNAKLGLSEIFVHTPKNVLRSACIPVEFIYGVIFNLCEPKFFTIETSNWMKVNVIHARAGTVGSYNYKQDMIEVAGISYERFLNYQKTARDLRKK